MADFPNIMTTKIVTDKSDELWKQWIEMPQTNLPVSTLVLTESFDPGSTDEIQLDKILQACKLENTDYYILKIQNDEKIAWHQLRDKLQPKIILLLGILPAQLGISAMFHLYHPNRFNDALWIASASLSELEKNPESKKQLWQLGLKPVFVDKTITLS